MKKTLLTLSVLLTGICGLCAYALKTEKTDRSNRETISARSLEVDDKLSTSELGRLKDIIKENQKTTSSVIKRAISADQRVDLWNTAPLLLSLNEGGELDASNDTFTFTGSEDSKNYIIAGADAEGTRYHWYTSEFDNYVFSGTLTATGDALVYPCVIYSYDSYLRIASGAYVRLNEENGHKAEFEVEAADIVSNCPLMVGFLVSESSDEVTVTSSDNSFYSYSLALDADKWTKETDLPGLGLNGLESDGAYTVLCEDGVTTLGLYMTYNAYYGETDIFLTGINTTATEATIPKGVRIDGTTYKIDSFGYSGDLDWSGASNLTKITLTSTDLVRTNFAGSPVTDLYLQRGCSFASSPYANSGTYLHIPYGATRSDYSGFDFKRVLVGDEQPWYPEMENADWVIAGEQDGDYFGIRLYDGSYRVVEVMSDKEKIELPLATPARDGLYYVRGAGLYYDSLKTSKAPNLNALVIPDSYVSLCIYWADNIEEVYMMGPAPETYNWLSSSVKVYIAREEDVQSYEDAYQWKDACLLPYGWDYGWTTVAVSGPGELAQTYLEANESDWAKGKNVKITGTLNLSDLENIKNLKELRKLDLSAADFEELPYQFLYQAGKVNHVVLPASVSAISKSAFIYCRRLLSVEAPGAERVAESAFYDCVNLRDFDLSRIRQIEGYAFYNCRSYSPEAFPSGLDLLQSCAFYGSGITEAVFPDSSIETIPYDCFRECRNLRKVELPYNVREIGERAFYECPALQEVTLHPGVETIGYSSFAYCSGLEEIVLPHSVKWIHDYAFRGCQKVKSFICHSVTPPAASSYFVHDFDMDHCTLYVPALTLDKYREDSRWSAFYIMKPLDTPLEVVNVTGPATFELDPKDNDLYAGIEDLALAWIVSPYRELHSIGQLTTRGEGSLSTESWDYLCMLERRDGYDASLRPSYINEGAKIHADEIDGIMGLEKNRWHFVSYPHDIRFDDISGINDTDFVIRKYNGARRAAGSDDGSNWENLVNGEVLEAGKGYIVQAANNFVDDNGQSYSATINFQTTDQAAIAKYFTSDDVTVPLEEHLSEFPHNSSWNLVGNPYPCYYDLSQLGEDFHSPVTFWRGSSYQAYSPVDDQIVLQPNEAFFVQRSEGADKMVFRKEGRMHYDQARLEFSNPGIFVAPEKTVGDASRSVFNFNVEGCGSDDRARIVLNEKASLGYEPDRDASKFFAEANGGVELFVNDALRYDICERPFGEGTAKLGINAATAGEYTLSLSGRNCEGWRVVIYDTKTKTTVCLSEMPYSFEAAKGMDPERFIVTFDAPDYSAVEDLSAVSFEEDVKVVSLSGQTLFEGKLDAFRDEAAAGVYIVVGKERTAKIIVK